MAYVLHRLPAVANIICTREYSLFAQQIMSSHERANKQADMDVSPAIIVSIIPRALLIDVVEVTKKRKIGQRQEDPIWQFFEKIPLDKAKAAQEHRNHDAKCKKCEKQLPGKPEKLKRHVANDCKGASHGDQLYALKQQAKVGTSESGSDSTADPILRPCSSGLSRFIDNVKISQSRMKQLQLLLCITFIMTGWSFSTVENPQFVDFMKNVRGNFELPSKHACCTSCKCCTAVLGWLSQSVTPVLHR